VALEAQVDADRIGPCDRIGEVVDSWRQVRRVRRARGREELPRRGLRVAVEARPDLRVLDADVDAPAPRVEEELLRELVRQVDVAQPDVARVLDPAVAHVAEAAPPLTGGEPRARGEAVADAV